MDHHDAEEVAQKAQLMADGLGISVWITDDGHIVQHRPVVGGTEVRPRPSARPTPYGAPANTETGDGYS